MSTIIELIEILSRWINNIVYQSRCIIFMFIFNISTYFVNSLIKLSIILILFSFIKLDKMKITVLSKFK